MEANAAGQYFAQAMKDGFHSWLLDQRSGHIEQGSIPAMGGASIVFRHAHQTSTPSTDLPHRDTLTWSVSSKPALSVCYEPKRWQTGQIRVIAIRGLSSFFTSTSHRNCRSGDFVIGV